MSGEPQTEAGRALLRDNFVITEHTDPRTRIADNLTAPQFVAAILDIERQAIAQERERLAAAVNALRTEPSTRTDFGDGWGSALDAVTRLLQGADR